MSKISHNEMKTLKKKYREAETKKNMCFSLLCTSTSVGFPEGEHRGACLPGNDSFLNCLFIRLDF